MPPRSDAARAPAQIRDRGRKIFDRRTIVQGALATGAGLLVPAVEAQTARPPHDGKFGYDEVVRRAKQLAASPYQGQLPPLPEEIEKLDWDAWSHIEFRNSKALLGGNGSQFRLELFHLGHLFKRPVVVNTIRDGIPTPIPYQPSDFSFGSTKFAKPLPVNLGFAGFKVRTPLNAPKKFDEFISFVGSSYFRFLGRGQQYGLSARGLAVDGGTNQEEFPFYREFWIETPKPEIDKLTIYALLDSSAATGAYRFDCYPKENSAVDVTATLVPRRDDAKLGLMCLTSMFFIGANNPKFRDDYRFELHDSDGLQIHNGAGEWLWRPLRNPEIAKTSSFLDHDPKGFGLLQRNRDFSLYEDIDLAYQLRPSYWVMPKTKLGDGHVELFEMPTTDETNDNIVASWVGKDQPEVGKPIEYGYSITSALNLDDLFADAKARNTFQTEARALGSSEKAVPTTRRFMIDFDGGDLAYFESDPSLVKVEASASNGRIVRAQTQYNPFIKGVRAMLDVDVPAGQTADVRAYLHDGPNVLTETWTFPWTAPAAPPQPSLPSDPGTR